MLYHTQLEGGPYLSSLLQSSKVPSPKETRFLVIFRIFSLASCVIGPPSWLHTIRSKLYRILCRWAPGYSLLWWKGQWTRLLSGLGWTGLLSGLAFTGFSPWWRARAGTIQAKQLAIFERCVHVLLFHAGHFGAFNFLAQ